MSRSHFATEEKVFDACLKLVMAGRRATSEAVRAELGGGSPNVVNPLITKWHKEKLAKILEPLGESEIARRSGVPPALLRLYDEVKAEVQREAQLRIDAGVAKAREAQQAAEERSAKDRLALDDVIRSEGLLRQAVALRDATVDDLQRSLSVERQQLVIEREKILQLEAQVQDLRSKLDDERKRSDEEIAKANQRAEAITHRSLNEIDLERTARSDSERRLAAATKRVDALVAEISENKRIAAEAQARLEGRLTHAIDALGQAETDRGLLSNRLSEANDLASGLREEVVRLQAVNRAARPAKPVTARMGSLIGKGHGPQLPRAKLRGRR